MIVRDPVSFNEATKAHRMMHFPGTLRCSGCSWQTTATRKSDADAAFRRHLIDVWRKARA